MKKVIVVIIVIAGLIFVALNFDSWHTSYQLKKAVYGYYEEGKSAVDFEYEGQLYRAYKYVCQRPVTVYCAEGVSVVKRERSSYGYMIDGQTMFNAGRNVSPGEKEPKLKIYENAFGEKALKVFRLIEEAQK